MPLVPPSFFGIVLGLAGLAGNWRAAHAVWSLPAAVGEALYAAAFLAWLAIALLYALKWLAAPAVAREEAEHAVQCCFIGLAGVATMLVAQGALPYSRPLAIGLFLLGAIFTIGFGLWRTGILWRGGRDATATTPVLYLPLVAGGFVTGTVSASLGWAEWGQLAFGAAFFAWLAIESVLLHRLYTAAPLALPLRPTLGIQLAPPAVGAVCYLSVGNGHADLFVHMLIGYALVQALLLARMARWLGQQPFGASYWAYTFGATALAGASIRVSGDAQAAALATLAPALFVLVNILVLGIAAGTVVLLLRGKLLPAPQPAASMPAAVPPAAKTP
ncbi:dicarboxylate transporter/tellurite-resistance protein TehA [Bordetella bronchialis]|uniref:Dicarboxylate transporter/tellurite-resistance protein TehA n=1 Tax=Bordetella bronchialis TaxID=463025 RepID=A0A193G5N8_9BORD|nr:dicarboxylate transporter/tellurite-resistance protein TehA [Bordetella bronchialis]ANN74539.1 dicarboxylate transporter/tellurite-resistance protein TehA [Bordetella bronchialis]